jgi:alpha-D-ribose 1-methylphosphonate 5-triphosphate synthase subunit PhnH
VTLTETILAAADLASPSEWPPLRALSADASQRIFRSCLAALSRPGLVGRIPADVLPPTVPPVVAPLLALTDLMAPLTGLDSDLPGAAWAAAIIGRTTGARITDPEQARFALAFSETERMAELSIGTPWSPEFGALLCQRVTRLAAHDQHRSDDHDLCVRLSGPGVPDVVEIDIDGLGNRFVQIRDQLAAGFPTGIDVLMITDDGAIAGLPRTTRIEVS